MYMYVYCSVMGSNQKRHFKMSACILVKLTVHGRLMLIVVDVYTYVLIFDVSQNIHDIGVYDNYRCWYCEIDVQISPYYQSRMI